MKTTAIGTVLFTIAGGLYIAQASDVIAHEADDPPSTALPSTATDTGTAPDTMLDEVIDVRPHRVLRPTSST